MTTTPPETQAHLMSKLEDAVGLCSGAVDALNDSDDNPYVINRLVEHVEELDQAYSAFHKLWWEQGREGAPSGDVTKVNFAPAPPKEDRDALDDLGLEISKIETASRLLGDVTNEPHDKINMNDMMYLVFSLEDHARAAAEAFNRSYGTVFQARRAGGVS